MLGDTRRYHGRPHGRGRSRTGGAADGSLERRDRDTPIRLTRPSRHFTTLDHHGKRLEAKGPVSEMSLLAQDRMKRLSHTESQRREAMLARVRAPLSERLDTLSGESVC